MLYAVNTRPGASLILARHASAIAFGEFVIYRVHGLFLVCVADDPAAASRHLGRSMTTACFIVEDDDDRMGRATRQR